MASRSPHPAAAVRVRGRPSPGSAGARPLRFGRLRWNSRSDRPRAPTPRPGARTQGPRSRTSGEARGSPAPAAPPPATAREPAREQATETLGGRARGVRRRRRRRWTSWGRVAGAARRPRKMKGDRCRRRDEEAKARRQEALGAAGPRGPGTGRGLPAPRAAQTVSSPADARACATPWRALARDRGARRRGRGRPGRAGIGPGGGAATRDRAEALKTDAPTPGGARPSARVREARPATRALGPGQHPEVGGAGRHHRHATPGWAAPRGRRPCPAPAARAG